MKIFRSAGAWLVTLMLACVLVSVPSTERAAAADVVPFVVNFSEAPATLDPSWACTYPDLVLTNFCSRLTEYGTKPDPHGTTQNDTGNIVLSFAGLIDISEDNLGYTVKLPEGATFPSGSPLVSSIETPDLTTVAVTLSRPDPVVLQLWAQPAVSVDFRCWGK